MTIEANHGPAPAGARAPARERERAGAVRRAQRHSRLVRILKIALPVVALAVGGLYFLSSGFTVSLGPLDASISRVEVSGDALRMVNPKIEGVTDAGGAFVVRADYADQDIATPTQITLSTVKAELTQPGKGWSRLTAPRGRYDSKTEALELLDDIQVTTESGLHAYLTSAAIDMNKQTVSSPEPVRAEMPNGTVRADTLHIDMATSALSFDGDVKVRVQRPPAKAATPAPAAQGGLAGMSLNSREPIDIAAPKLVIDDKSKLARFLGGVTAVQGGAQMTSQELKVHYASADADAPESDSEGAAGAAADIRLIEAVDQVRLLTSDGRQATGQRMVFDTQKQTVLLEGGVVLTQGDDTLKGESLIVDLTTGITRFGPQSRVVGHLAARAEPSGTAVAQPKSAEAGPGSIDLSGTRGKPLDIDADTLTVDDRKRVAVFTGNVRTVQGDMTVRSGELTVDYSGEGGAAGAGTAAAQAGAQIKQITAKGKVLITSQDQTSTSDWAVFDVKAQTVVIGGNVVLSQGENVIKGDRLVIDTTTGRSRFENEGDLSTGHRVRGLFRPKSSDQNGRESPSARPAPGGGFFAAPRG